MTLQTYLITPPQPLVLVSVTVNTDWKGERRGRFPAKQDSKGHHQPKHIMLHDAKYSLPSPLGLFVFSSPKRRLKAARTDAIR